MGRLSTHVLDLVEGGPARGMQVELVRLFPDGRRMQVSRHITNVDGRMDQPLLSGDEAAPGTFELVFHVGAYFRAKGAALQEPAFLDEVPVRFSMAADGHYHVPLLCSPWSYSTYRGS